ncbi:MAG: helix-turn-helix domain-containing protein [Candidatus Hydrothermarchaeales archaeon]
MINKTIICPDRVRKISGSFAFIEHRFLRDGFYGSLDHHELLLYLFLVIVGDRNGMSFYSYDKICTLLRVSVDEYILARNSLIENDLIAFDGKFFQVLSLPEKVLKHSCPPLRTQGEMEKHDPATIHQRIVHSLGGIND